MLADKKYIITKVTDTIFKLKPFEGIELTIEDVYDMRRIYLELSNGGSFAVLLDATEVFSITAEARSLLASKEFTEKRYAAALVTKSLANKLVGNFFIKFNKPATPTKLFTDETIALEWLKEQGENLNSFKNETKKPTSLSAF